MTRIKEKKKRKRILGNMIYAVVMILFFLLAAELLTRTLYKTPGYGYPPGLQIKDALNGYKYKPNFTGNFVGAYSNISISINSKGFRDYEYSYDKLKGMKRIIVIGDSETFGAGVPVEDTYVKQLEQIFRKNNQSFQVLNLGINSYDFPQEFNLMKTEGIKFKPDIVLVGFVLNDIGKVNAKKVQFREIILRQCHLCVFANTLAKTLNFNGKNYNTYYFEALYKKWQGSDWEYTKAQIKELNDFAQQNNFTLVFVVFPYAEQLENNPNRVEISNPWLPQHLLKEACIQDNITLIDLRQILDVPNYQQYFLNKDSLHLNAEGYGIIANDIYNQMEEKGII